MSHVPSVICVTIWRVVRGLALSIEKGRAVSSDEEMNVNPNPGLIQDASVLISSFTITTHQAPGTQEHNSAAHHSPPKGPQSLLN